MKAGDKVWWWNIKKGDWVKEYGIIDRIEGEWAYFKYAKRANDGNISYLHQGEFRRRWAKLHKVSSETVTCQA